MSQQEELLKDIVDKITGDNHLHARWLNTLSMMENTGARKIARCEHPVKTDIVILKHAAEESRHAYYLKKQIGKIAENECMDYSFSALLAPLASYHYLHKLDVEVSRYLKDELHKTDDELKFGSYLLVTYAIEVRAEMLYPIYQKRLDDIGSKVNVKSIILEEDAHLEEMIRMLKRFHPEWERISAKMCSFENYLFDNWLTELNRELT